jgi:DNA-binding protein HU-beta
MPTKSMSKNQIISKLSIDTGLTKKDVMKVWNSLNDLARSQVKRIGQFRVLDLGKLKLRNNKARTMRSPTTGKTINIPSRTVVKFSVASNVKTLIK